LKEAAGVIEAGEAFTGIPPGQSRDSPPDCDRTDVILADDNQGDWKGVRV
jgi:hypothetical protein